MIKLNKIDINTISYRALICNLYLTQLISLLVAFFLFMIFFNGNIVMLISIILPKNILKDFLIAILFTSAIVLINIVLAKILPKRLLDDGGINKKLFTNTPIWHIAIISLIVGFTEEFLFRIFVQEQLGITFTSIIFTLIHFRYFDKIVLVLFTFITSLFLGYLVVVSEWFTAFLAHALIDLTLGILVNKKYLE